MAENEATEIHKLLHIARLICKTNSNNKTEVDNAIVTQKDNIGKKRNYLKYFPEPIRIWIETTKRIKPYYKKIVKHINEFKNCENKCRSYIKQHVSSFVILKCETDEVNRTILLYSNVLEHHNRKELKCSSLCPYCIYNNYIGDSKNYNNMNGITMSKDKDTTKKKLNVNAKAFNVSSLPTVDPYNGPYGISTRPDLNVRSAQQLSKTHVVDKKKNMNNNKDNTSKDNKDNSKDSSKDNSKDNSNNNNISKQRSNNIPNNSSNIINKNSNNIVNKNGNINRVNDNNSNNHVYNMPQQQQFGTKIRQNGMMHINQKRIPYQQTNQNRIPYPPQIYNNKFRHGPPQQQKHDDTNIVHQGAPPQQFNNMVGQAQQQQQQQQQQQFGNFNTIGGFHGKNNGHNNKIYGNNNRNNNMVNNNIINNNNNNPNNNVNNHNNINRLYMSGTVKFGDGRISIDRSKPAFAAQTSHPYAKAVGVTVTYKPNNRPHGYSRPTTEDVDPTFTNSCELRRYQKWELLESAKRWLPGEGTFITWYGYRYLIGPPIHMGMNGHIHYCYKYPIPNYKGKQSKDSSKYIKKSKNQQKNQLKNKQKNNNCDNNSNNNNNNNNIIDIDIKTNNIDELNEFYNRPNVETVAAKIVPNTPAFAREIVILRALQNCENVAELFDVLESQRTLISILELAQADVYNFFVGRVSKQHGWSLEKPAIREHFGRMVISNVVQGLDQMHKSKYLHCDLKSLNILLYVYITDHSNRRGGVYVKAKITDFGHSSHGEYRIADKLFHTGMARVGTAGHVAPELFIEASKCDNKIDIWSLGVVMFSILVPGRLIFGEYTDLPSLKKGYDRVNRANPWSTTRPSWWNDFERLSPEARDLILLLTRYNPKERPTCEQILQHPWFKITKLPKCGPYRPKLKYVDMICTSSIAQE